ncbi:MAG TPA: MBL fold metallo-hydrolase [Ktedonobacterales bacterium]|nr:MBL fold metallo-hydrolase [Ktedonobacterales bacterium]
MADTSQPDQTSPSFPPPPTLALLGREAAVHVLVAGYARGGGAPGLSLVASTVTFVRDGAALIVVDPGMVADRELGLLAPLAALGVAPEAITDVIFSHHHPDHTVNAALFPQARIHDIWAIYTGDHWQNRTAEGYQVSPSVLLLETPGHSPQDITTLIGAPSGLVACTHLWWAEQGPAEDPRATDLAALHRQRARVLAIPGLTLIVPGHGPAFAPTDTTPR